MKTIKKILGMFLALFMVFGLGTTVNAEAPKTTITITNGANGSTYYAYKLLDATNDSTDKTKFSYSVNSKYGTILTSVIKNEKNDTSGEAVDIVGYISGLTTSSSTTIQKFADDVYAAIKDSSPAINKDYEATAEKTGDAAPVATFSNVEQGYYLIVEHSIGTTDESEADDTYSLVMLDTAGLDTVSVATKENTPTLEKKVKETNDSVSENSVSDWQDAADYDVSDTVPFQLKGSVSAKIASYKKYKYIFHDTLSNGLTLDADSIKVYADIDGDGTFNETNDLIDAKNYSVVTTGLTDGCSFEVRFTDLKTAVTTVNASTKIYVRYNATLNGNAVIGSTGNPNTAKLEYSTNPYYDVTGTEETGKTPEDKVIVFTYKLIANKTDKDGNALNGAGFTLFKYDADATTDNKYVAVGSELKGTDQTTFEFNRVDAGKYKLVETTVPAGYNKADDLYFEVVATYDTESSNPTLSALSIKDSKGNVISGDVENASFTTNVKDGSATTNVVNNSGTELPSTGGIGTTIFYVVGGIMVVGAAVILVTKKRMSNDIK